jgi:hypothetical protein
LGVNRTSLSTSAGQPDEDAAIKQAIEEFKVPANQRDRLKQPGFRVLEDRYGANLLALAVPKGHARRLAYVQRVCRRSQSIRLSAKAIDRAGPRGVTVAPTGDVP